MAVPESLVLATRNPHKLAEFGRLLSPHGITVQALPDDIELPPEDGETFAENALLKARAAAAATARAAIADDSGIEALALDGRPGVRSARYAGPGATDEQNLAKLMSEAPAGSELRYVCALAYAERRGARGFGYDPAFLPDGDHGERTMAELTEREKDEISHRGRAVMELLTWL